MPSVPDLSDSDDVEPTYDLVDDATGSVGFVDAPDLGAGDLMTVVVDALSRLAEGAVLTVYSGHLVASDIADRCTALGVELVHAVPQPNGTSFVLRRSGG